MSQKFQDTEVSFIQETFKGIEGNKKSAIDFEYTNKDLELKLKNDYATFKDFRNKKGEVDIKMVKMPLIKNIMKIIEITNDREEQKILLENQKELLENVLNSFEDNEKNNELFKLGAGKKPDDVEKLIEYIKDYLQKDLNNDLIKSMIKNNNSIAETKQNIKDIEKDMTGKIPKDELKIIKELVDIAVVPYKEKKEQEFNIANKIEKKVKKVDNGTEKTDLEDLIKILNLNIQI
jgi:hypothetical protein